MPQLGLGSSLTRGGVLSGFENKYSLDFDGGDDHLLIAATNDLSFGDGSIDSAFTVAAWVYMDDATAFRIVSKDGGVVGSKREYEFMTETDHDNLYMFLRDETAGAWAYVRTDSTITSYEGSWVHLATTYDGGGGENAADGIKIYINGDPAILDTPVTNEGYIAMENNGGDFYIGRKVQYYANGKFDEVAVWDAELDAAAVDAIHNSGTPIALDADSGNYDNSGNLVGWWRMGDGTLDDGNIAGNGLIADQVNPTLGSDLVTNGGFDADSDWTTGSGWTIGSDVATCDGTSGNLQSTSDTVVSGKLYKMQFEITAYTSGSVKIWSGSGSDLTSYRNTEGIHTDYFKTNSTSIALYSLSFVGSVDNISVQIVNGNSGIMTSMAATFSTDVPA